MQPPTPGSDTHRVSSSHTECAAYSPALAVTPRTPGSDYSAKSNDEDEGDVEKDLADGIRKLSINLNPYRYHGKSSNLMFLQSVLMQRYPGNDRPKTAEGVLGLRQYMRDTPADYPASVLSPCC